MRNKQSATHLTVADGVAQAVGAAGTGPGQSLFPNEEVEVSHDARAVLRLPVPLSGGGPRLVGEGVVDGDGGRGDEAGLHVPGESHLRIPATVPRLLTWISVARSIQPTRIRARRSGESGGG